MAIFPQLLLQGGGAIMSIVFADITVLLTLVAGMVIVLLGLNAYRKSLKLPPGPTGFPIVGIIPLIKKEFHLLLFDYSRIFGKILSFKMGTETIVVLSDYKTIKNAFRSRDFVSRPKSELSQLLGGYGIVNSEGDLWKSQRRYILHQKLGMRHWNDGMKDIEKSVQSEVLNFLNVIHRDHSGVPVNPSALINCAVSNVICSMIMTKRFEHRDPQFKRFMQLFDEGFRLFTLTGAMIFLPFLKHLPGVATACKQLRANREEMLGFVRGVIQEHRENLNHDEPKDLIDAYLIEIDAASERKAKNGDDKPNIFHGFDADTQIEQVVLDLFSAGTETLKTSLLWAIVYMLHNPEVKKKVQAELDSVVESNSMPTLSNMSSLPYTTATLYEIMRRSSVVPMGTTHATEKEVQFEGFVIPKNAHVIPLLHAVHMNPEYWDEPEAFRPERFLSEDGLTVRKPEHFMPFGVGQRMCLGDKLAEKEFFLFFASLLYVFDVENPKGVALPGLRGVAGVTVTPQEFEVVCTPRKSFAPRTSG